MNKKDRYIKEVLGIRVSITQYDRVLRKIKNWVENGRVKRYVVTPNVEIVMLAQKDKQFKKVLNEADLSIADSIGVAWAVNTSRVTGEEVMMGLVKMAASEGWKIMLLGGKPGVAFQAAEKLKNAWPGLKIVGFSGPKNVLKASREEQNKTIKKINAFKPDLLMVGFGQVKQEKWISSNLNKLNVKVAMGVGGSIDKVVKPWLKAPELIKRVNLEWLWRLLMQPWRLKRQLALIKFVCLAVLKKERS